MAKPTKHCDKCRIRWLDEHRIVGELVLVTSAKHLSRRMRGRSALLMEAGTFLLLVRLGRHRDGAVLEVAPEGAAGALDVGGLRLGAEGQDALGEQVDGREADGCRGNAQPIRAVVRRTSASWFARATRLRVVECRCLSDAERELADVLWIAEHFADARVHPTRPSAPAPAGCGNARLVELVREHRVRVALEVQSEAAAIIRSHRRRLDRISGGRE